MCNSMVGCEKRYFTTAGRELTNLFAEFGDHAFDVGPYEIHQQGVSFVADRGIAAKDRTRKDRCTDLDLYLCRADLPGFASPNVLQAVKCYGNYRKVQF